MVGENYSRTCENFFAVGITDVYASTATVCELVHNFAAYFVGKVVMGGHVSSGDVDLIFRAD